MIFSSKNDPSFAVDEEFSGALALTATQQATISKALNGMPMVEDPRFSSEVNERLATAGEHANKAVASVVSPWPAVVRLLQAAYSAQTTGKRVLWINKAADALASRYGPVSACKSGCTHCCHIPVKITKAEADAIGKAINRKPRQVNDDLNTGFDLCTFLIGERCSIYEHRPSVCRTHMNMDRDDLLCRLVPDAAIPVPYLDTRPLALTRVELFGTNATADIRNWFPAKIGDI